MADGNIVINTKVNQAGFKSGVSSIKSGLKGLAAAVGIAFGTAAIINFGKASVKASNDFENAMTGLKSVMEGQGRSFQQSEKFINDYVADGLIPATDAITSYKNLALRGYDDSQIQQVMLALKDSAAYGRQASYSMGEAVKSASEGLKNENSILVDNAGVTKNVAKMWDDYARSIGTSANNLTTQQKIQAEVNGIMQETKFQTGDAAKVANSFSGQVLQLQFNFNNLKIAVGNMIKPILTAVFPAINIAIAAFTRLANLIAQIATALFGKQAAGFSAVAESASAASEAQDGVASSTKKAAKAAKGSVASFDQLNVIQSDSGADGGDSSSPDVGGGVSVPTLDGEIGGGITVSPAVETAVNTIKSLLAPLKDIKFDNLVTAFDNLKEAVKPFVKSLFSGLEWAWTNLLVPLAKWVIEDYLPAWLEAVAGWFNVFTAIIEALKPLAIWLWDSFLKPIASFTGGIIVEWLKFLATALTAISDWITEHQTLIQNIIIVIGAFALAWGLVTLALNAWNIAVAIWNAIGVIATAVTTGFGAAVAFLTSPVTLVILAIGALIAIIVLLVKNWDWIKAKAIEVWNKIKEIWGAVAAWFRDNVVTPVKTKFTNLWNDIKGKAIALWTAMKIIFGAVKGWFNNNVILPVKTKFTNLWTGVKTGATNLWNGLKNVFLNSAKWFNNKVVTPIKDFFGGLWRGIQTGASTLAGYIRTYVIDPIVNAFKWMYNSVVGIVEGVINGFIGIINAFIRGINNIIDKINNIPILGVSLGYISTIGTVSIPRMARGGIVDAPTVAQIGERGREAVLPLENHTGWMDVLADKIAGRVSAVVAGAGNSGGDIYVYLDSERISAAIERRSKRRNLRTNGR